LTTPNEPLISRCASSRFADSYPIHGVEREPGKQLLRAGMGVVGNYWSACRGRSDKEFVAKLGIATERENRKKKKREAGPSRASR
jgi:hypothetical protein